METDRSTGAPLPHRPEPMWKGRLRTLRRILSDPSGVVSAATPTFEFPDLRAVTPEFLEREGVRLVLWDVDGTLMELHGDRVDPALEDAFSAIARAGSFHQAVVSNCGEARFDQLQEILPDLPIVIGYRTGEDQVFRIGRGGEEKLERLDGTAVHGLDPSWTLLRKPEAGLVDAAIAQFPGIEKRETLLVGDQYFTDIASAGMAGIRSAKVRTVDPASFPFINRLGQRVEAAVVSTLGGPSRTS